MEDAEISATISHSIFILALTVCLSIRKLFSGSKASRHVTSRRLIHRDVNRCRVGSIDSAPGIIHASRGVRMPPLIKI